LRRAQSSAAVHEEERAVGSMGHAERVERTGVNQRPQEHLDVVIVGAGISGIDAAYRTGQRNPHLRYAILERRTALGGTWDLFRFPGVRSDSDVVTLGFPFRPYRGEQSIVDGATIRRYVGETAQEYGIDRRIRYGHEVIAADWSSATSRWTLTCTVAGDTVTITCGFLLACAGYYDGERGYAPEWAGLAEFGGPVIHPQRWPEGLNLAGKRVVVVGSGATAVTLVPALTETAAHVTMLQRSPSYIVALPSSDALATKLRSRLPQRVADGVIRWKNVALSAFTHRFARKRPDRFRALVRGGVLKALGPAYDEKLHDVDVHFNPPYAPWDQRLCVAPDGDFFNALRTGRASVVTGRIAAFTRDGIRLDDGRHVPADVVVTATGLAMRFFGGVGVRVDGEQINIGNRLVYKGMMLEGVPNLAFAFGYTHSSWTLKVDLNMRFVAKLLRYMKRRGLASATPVARGEIAREPLLDLTSGYVERASALLPKRGPRPWRHHDNYFLDLFALLTDRISDGTLRFAKDTRKKIAPSAQPKRPVM
jgi:cation diffusion facilitator CzcD-associated flavoprotein CzcO